MTVQELKKSCDEKFITARAKLENRIETWALEFKQSSLYKEMESNGEIPFTDLKLKAICPELYKEKPIKEIYEAEYKVLKDFADLVNSYISTRNKEALACLSEYKKNC